ncbi:hypothetical protein ABT56_05395 [Photobacterium aquae]|uniref:SPOR domain-containing protein n=1 Tax=Photobacterium aquae TaxID=1195763 RepID=A0A0J1H731_9GAMM|nr:AAA family ATPase [Photobacterium aquae]KLV07499.1 hypothetical protein ABT56_05395 [Photobacterium aquae]
MNTDMHTQALDLDSQTQLLSRLQFLTRFSSNLIHITGAAGAGKTWLSQRYLEAWAGARQQALLLCHASQTASQQRAYLLQQLAPKAVFNDQDPLGQTLERIFAGERVDMLLVVDDAHLLSPVLVAELWDWHQQTQANRGSQVNVLLFSLPGRLDSSNDQTTAAKEIHPIEVDISALDEQESLLFVERALGLQLDAAARRWYREQLGGRDGNLPGDLVKMQYSDDTATAGYRFSPKAALALGGAAALLGLGWWLWSAEPAPSPAPVVSGGINQQQLDQALVAADAKTVSGNTDLPASGIYDDSASLPPEVMLEGQTVGRKDSPPRVVVPSAVVDAMLDEQAVGGSGENAVVARQDLLQPVLPEGKPVLEPKSAEEKREPVPVVAPELKPEPKAKPEAQTVTKPPVVPKQAAAETKRPTAKPVPEVKAAPKTPPADKSKARAKAELGATLRQYPPQHYALQLAAVRSLQAAEEFLADYDMAGKATVYRTLRSGEPWFIIVTGNYRNVAAAREAEDSLPARVQAVQPWAKSFRQIQLEMDRVK